jgi:NADH dehydrogenase FAD-containing subunit
MKKISVVIAGGGFAGLSAAMHLDKTLAQCGAVEVTLISRENFILFTPMLPREIEQMITLRDVEALSELTGRLRPRAAEQTLFTSTPAPEAANHIQT